MEMNLPQDRCRIGRYCHKLLLERIQRCRRLLVRHIQLRRLHPELQLHVLRSRNPLSPWLLVILHRIEYAMSQRIFQELERTAHAAGVEQFKSVAIVCLDVVLKPHMRLAEIQFLGMLDAELQIEHQGVSLRSQTRQSVCNLIQAVPSPMVLSLMELSSVIYTWREIFQRIRSVGIGQEDLSHKTRIRPSGALDVTQLLGLEEIREVLDSELVTKAQHLTFLGHLLSFGHYLGIIQDTCSLDDYIDIILAPHLDQDRLERMLVEDERTIHRHCKFILTVLTGHHIFEKSLRDISAFVHLLRPFELIQTVSDSLEYVDLDSGERSLVHAAGHTAADQYIRLRKSPCPTKKQRNRNQHIYQIFP